MEKKNYKEFVKLMTVLGETFDKPASEAKIEIYFQSFQDWNIEQFSKACTKILQTKTISNFENPNSFFIMYFLSFIV